jgi:hypothetical protein
MFTIFDIFSFGKLQISLFGLTVFKDKEAEFHKLFTVFFCFHRKFENPMFFKSLPISFEKLQISFVGFNTVLKDR